MELTVQELTRKYKEKTAVDNVSLRLKEGVNGLLEANGAGKTTLMRMLSGILKPTAGTISLDGVDVSSEDYRAVLGYLPQDFGYYPDFTGEDFLLYLAALKGISRPHAKRKARELLELVSLQDAGKKKIRTYSGGMKQRLGIAQALLNDPRLLIIDEPTAGLDPKERVKFRRLLAGLGEDTVVLYGDREETLESVWAKLPEGQADFWRAKEAQVEKPFVYRNATGWRRLQEHTFFLYMLLPALAAAGLCGVLSEERRLRTDTLLLSSKEGRFPLYLAKVLAGITVVTAAALIMADADAIIITLHYGLDGFDAALQLWITTSSLPFTMGGATLRLYSLMLLYILIFGGLTMLISAITKNTVAALVVPVLGMIMMKYITPTNAWIAMYWPKHFYSVGPAFATPELVPFFGGYLTNLQVDYLIYGALALLLTTLCWLGWRHSADG